MPPTATIVQRRLSILLSNKFCRKLRSDLSSAISDLSSLLSELISNFMLVRRASDIRFCCEIVMMTDNYFRKTSAWTGSNPASFSTCAVSIPSMLFIRLISFRQVISRDTSSLSGFISTGRVCFLPYKYSKLVSPWEPLLILPTVRGETMWRLIPQLRIHRTHAGFNMNSIFIHSHMACN